MKPETQNNTASDDASSPPLSQRLWLLAAIAAVSLAGSAASAAYFGFVIVGGEDSLLAFGTAMAFTAGPAVLIIIFSYLMLFKDPR